MDVEVRFISIVIFFSLFRLASGCSIPEGGFVEAGMAGKVFYADIVAVGTVTEIIDDPSPWSYPGGSTYGAAVVIWCTYKALLPRTIIIGQAGFVPGLCWTMDLELNTDYILFLHHHPISDFYIQEHIALPLSELDVLKNVYDLDLTYTPGPAIGLGACPLPTTSRNCTRYDETEEIDEEK